MSSLPNNVLHVSPSATFFPLPSSIFIAPLSSSLHPLISPTLCDCGKLMGLSHSSRKPAFLLNWCLGWRMRGTQMFAIPALQRWCRARCHVTGCQGTEVITYKATETEPCWRMPIDANKSTAALTKRTSRRSRAFKSNRCERVALAQSVCEVFIYLAEVLMLRYTFTLTSSSVFLKSSSKPVALKSIASSRFCLTARRQTWAADQKWSSPASCCVKRFFYPLFFILVSMEPVSAEVGRRSD